MFGSPARTVTVRAELSRFRRSLDGPPARRLYRFTGDVDMEVILPGRPADLLPRSTAPAGRAGRGVCGGPWNILQLEECGGWQALRDLPASRAPLARVRGP
ncbi:hypothetical protein AB0E78_30520 [Streptomyces sp. NPDC032198]|uniref:hypothetical protein n=1 Tax=Streptomyces sp. NPDC032198 TaxID=3155127 RepID=UPI0033E5B1D3